MDQNQNQGTMLNGEPVEVKTSSDLKSENVLAGTVGAFLFALVGGVLWYVLYQIGFLAAISGIVGVICAIKGYSFFAKRESIKGVVISVIMAVLVIVIAWYFCLSTDVYNAYQQWYADGDIDYTVTFFEAVRGAYLFLSESDILLGYLADLGIGILLCIVGCIQPIANAVRKAKKA